MLDGLSFTLSDEDFQSFSELVHRKAGIKLHGGKKELVRARLTKRIRDGNFDGFRDYYQYVIADKSGDELVQLLDAISTNLTHFFREPRHFDFLTDTILSDIRKRSKKTNTGRFRVWSAGCSTGEEPYSIAISVAEYAPDIANGDFKVLATDLSTQALATAMRGVYNAERVKNIPQATLRKFFRKGRGGWEGWFMAKESLKRMIVFRHFNLMRPLPFKHPFDLIFCRNVMIYFDKKHTSRTGGAFLPGTATGRTPVYRPLRESYRHHGRISICATHGVSEKIADAGNTCIPPSGG